MPMASCYLFLTYLSVPTTLNNPQAIGHISGSIATLGGTEIILINSLNCPLYNLPFKKWSEAKGMEGQNNILKNSQSEVALSSLFWWI